MSYERSDSRSDGPRRGRWLGAAVAAALMAGALPAVASAADYCVAPNTSCGGTNVATFDQALSSAAAAPDADRIFLGTATYTAPTADGFFYLQSSSPVEIVGQGEGHTILTSPGGGDGVLDVTGGPGTSVHDLTIRLPQNAAYGESGLTTSNTAQRIEVVEDPSQTNVRYGVWLGDGGTLEDSTVTLDSTKLSTAVFLASPSGGTVRHSVLCAWQGVRSDGGGTIERSQVTGSEHAVLDYGSVTAISDSLLRTTGYPYGVGIDAVPRPGIDATVTADGVTIIGSGAGNTSGVRADLEGATTESAHVTLTNSVIRGAAYPLNTQSFGTGQATISASYSDYDPSGDHDGGGITQANDSNVGDAGFVDAANGDYRLSPGSPLIDAGDPATAQGFDLDGNPLVADGNGDGIARRDMGAFEYQPAPSGGRSGPSGSGQPALSSGGGSGADTQAPLISGFKATPAVFAVAHASTALAARAHRGTTFRYTLSEDSRITLTIRRALAGHRHGGKCVRPSRRLVHAARCTRYQTVATLTRPGRSGANSIVFSGRIGRRALAGGSYRAVIRATDGSGNHSAPKATRFRITNS
jgi:hypothetical protein